MNEIAAATRVLEEAGLVAFPTDTVYGLGCLATNEVARRRFYAVKRRDPAQPAVVMVAGADDAHKWARLDGEAGRLASKFWPGALTLVLPATDRAQAELGEVCGGGTIAVRVPDHQVALELLGSLASPLATSSANRAGAEPPLTATEVAAGLGEEVDLILSGSCGGGVASTILDMTGAQPTILRQGSILSEALLK